MEKAAVSEGKGEVEMANPVIENIRRSLGRSSQTLLGRRPDIYPPRRPGSTEAEIEQFLQEIKDLHGTGERLALTEMDASLKRLVSDLDVKKAALWDTSLLNKLNLGSRLQALGVELVPPTAEKHLLAQCDLGVTEADFLLPETGTVVLRSSAQKPRAVSLLPITHLVLASPHALRPDMHQVFNETKNDPYLVFITGASRTGDIEMIATLGVHGPKNLYVWLIQE